MAPSDAYFRPTDLDAALGQAVVPGTRIVAGCTDVFPATDRKMLSGRVLDITAVDGLRGITRGAEGLRIGAATTWGDLHRADLPPALHGLQQAAREVGALQIQNRGTIGGNLCNASPAADGVPPLLTLEAEVELASTAGTRRLALADFLRGPRQTACDDGEILTAVHLPAAALDGQGHFQKLGARTYLVISIAMVAARLVVAEGRITQAAVAVGACGPVATRLPTLEARLVGATRAVVTPADVTPCLAPIDDMRADAAYRRRSAVALVQATLDAALMPEAA